MDTPPAQAADGNKADSSTAADAERGTPAWNAAGQHSAAGGQASAGTLLDPLTGQQLSTDQLAAMLSTGGYTATALGSLGGLHDNAATLNALLLSGGLNLNTLAAAQNLQSLQLAGLGGADLSQLMGGDGGDMEDHAGGGGGGKSSGLNVTSNKQLSSRFR